MTLSQFARRSLRHYFRAHLGVLAGATVAAAVLIGALAVGDSVRESLKERARQRLGPLVETALDSGDRFFTTNLSATLIKEASNKSGQVLNVGRLLIMNPAAAVALHLPATATRQDGTARANGVALYGVTPDFFYYSQLPPRSQAPSPGETWISEALARQLHARPDDELILRVHKPSALSRDAVITPRDGQSIALRLRVGRVLAANEGGIFGLHANQLDPLNAFIAYDTLANGAGLPGRANLLLSPVLARMGAVNSLEQFQHKFWSLFHRGWQTALNSHLTARSHLLPSAEQAAGMAELSAGAWSLADAELDVHAVTPIATLSGGEAGPSFAELTTRRIFLEPAVVTAALGTNPAAASVSGPATPVLTYLVNSLRAGDRLTPYSMVTAAGAPYTPADLKEDEIVVNEWLAKDLGVKPGDTIALAYYRVDAGTKLVERTNLFRVHSIVPLRGLPADRTLMPEFPGLAKAESTRDWDAGFDLVHPIREQDEAYWKQWRGTPKAFISLAAGKKLWANRFGELTAIRWFPRAGESATTMRDKVAGELRARLNPADVGLVWQPVHARALAAATNGQDFGGLFIGFSFFLIGAALLLMAMLFQFALEQRAMEAGLLLALGWQPKRVRRVLFREGFLLAVLGSLMGAAVGALYARGILWGLSTLWRDAVAGAGLEFHLTFETLVLGFGLSLLTAAATMALALRSQAKRPARELLNEGARETTLAVAARPSRWAGGWAIGTTVAALGLTGAAWASRETGSEAFFAAGALWLIAGLLWVRWWIRRRLVKPGAAASPTAVAGLTGLALRALARRPSRALATVALLASAAFLIVAVGANKLDAGREAVRRSSGTGGFALWGESTLPVIQDLNTVKGQEFYGLDPRSFTNVAFVQFRVHDGDDASCLNLNRAQRPRLLAVNPAELARRGAFTFTALADGVVVTNGWLALQSAAPGSDSGVPEVPGVADANSIQWALGKKLGDTLDYLDERGRPFKVRLVGAVANSILQGNVLMAEGDFTRLFPSESGYRAFLLDAPASQTDTVTAGLTRALQDVGLELTPTTERLARFNAVQNTYLETFQVLGGLGLLLGSVGLGVVVLRNVYERRGELALMQAIGFERSRLRRMVLTEHGALLLGGLGVGIIAALVAVLPAVLTSGAALPWRSLSATLLLVLLNGAVWTWLATRQALRGRLLDGLREL